MGLAISLNGVFPDNQCVMKVRSLTAPINNTGYGVKSKGLRIFKLSPNLLIWPL